MRWVPPLLAVLHMGFAPAPFPRPDRSATDLKAIQGKWSLVSERVAGKEQGSAAHRATVSGHRIHLEGPISVQGSWTIAINSSATAKALDMRADKDGRMGMLLKCAFAVEGDEFRVSFHAEATGVRPAAMSGAGSATLLVFKRKKP